LSRSDLNLEVAKREKLRTLLVYNFKETYQGFDPNKPESLIGEAAHEKRTKDTDNFLSR
jgi:N-acetylmuramoyl-L-alanine amidase